MSISTPKVRDLQEMLTLNGNSLHHVAERETDQYWYGYFSGAADGYLAAAAAIDGIVQERHARPQSERLSKVINLLPKTRDP
jgi:hypothetical protein